MTQPYTHGKIMSTNYEQNHRTEIAQFRDISF